MPIQTQSADGVTHEFPDGTSDTVVDRVMKDYASKQAPSDTGISGYPHAVAENFRSGTALARSGLQDMRGADFSIEGENAAILGAGKYLLGGVQELTSPITGASDAFVVNPIKKTIPGKVGEFVGNTAGAATSLIGGGGAAKGAQAIGKLAGKGSEEVAGVASRIKPGAMSSAKAAAAEAEAAIPKAQAEVARLGNPESDASVLGRKMHKTLISRVNELTSERRKIAAELKAKYFADGIPKEREIADAYRGDLAKAAANKRGLVEEERDLVKESSRRMAEDPSIEAIEKERRRLDEIASGLAEGYGGIAKLYAGSMARNLRAQIVSRVRSAEKFIDSYAEASAPINMFEDTALGKRITKSASDYLPEQPHYDPAGLPKAFFKTKDSMATLRTLAGEDEEFVNGAAGEYVASELKDLGATQARSWLKKNKIWLDEVPEVQAEAEEYVSNLEDVSHTHEKALQYQEKVADTQKKAGRAVAAGVIGGAAAEGWNTLKHFMGL